MDKISKYMNIVNWTEKQISTGMFCPGDRFLSESELGKRFNCSRQTVRRALEVLEENGHVSRVQGSGTFISQGQSYAYHPVAIEKKASMTIGIISTHLDEYIYPSIIRGIEDVLTANGYAVQLAFTKNLVSGETRALQNMLDTNLDGLIVDPTKSGLPCFNLDLYQAMKKKGLPLVFINSNYLEFPSPYVALDDEKAGYMATQHLLSMGHRNIGGIFSHSYRQGHLRYLGHIKALFEAGLAIQDDRIFWYTKENLPEILRGKQLMDGISECTAMLCFNDTLALSMIELTQNYGKRVPEDISLVGIDNCELAAFCSLTSVIHPGEKLGEAAAKSLLSMINGAEVESILFPPQLVVRSSVKRLTED